MRMKVAMVAGTAALCVAVILAASMVSRSEPEKIVFGFPPGEASSMVVLREQFGSICEAVGDALGVECELVLTTSYPAVMEALRNGTVDVIRVGATLYVRTRGEFDMRPVALDVIDGEYHYHAVWIGRPGLWEEPFTMDQVRGKSMALVDPSSTSGYLAPMVMLAEAGLGLDDLGSYFFSVNHPSGIEALLNGQVDVMSTASTLLPEIDASGRAGDYVVLAESPELVTNVWIVGPSVDRELGNRITDILLNLPPSVFEASWISGLAPVGAETFAFNEAMLRVIGEK